MLTLFLNIIFAGCVFVVAEDFIIVTIIIIIIIIIITCSKVANAIKQCSIHFLSVEL